MYSCSGLNLSVWRFQLQLYLPIVFLRGHKRSVVAQKISLLKWSVFEYEWYKVAPNFMIGCDSHPSKARLGGITVVPPVRSYRLRVRERWHPMAIRWTSCGPPSGIGHFHAFLPFSYPPAFRCLVWEFVRVRLNRTLQPMLQVAGSSKHATS